MGVGPLCYNHGRFSSSACGTKCRMYAVEFQTTVKDGVIESPPEYRGQVSRRPRAI